MFSGNQLKIIPTDPNFEPSKIKQRDGLLALSRICKDNEITSTLNRDVVFVDPGQGFEKVLCNHCGQIIDVEYWQQSMDTAHQKSFTDLTIQTPCCNTLTTLNRLEYIAPSGFSKFQFTIINPDLDEIEISHIKPELEKIFTVELRMIRASY